MRDHVIVCGLQGVGLRIVEQLHLSGTPVLVVDDSADSRFGRLLEDWGVPHLRRSAYMGDALLEAGLEHALAVVCAELPGRLLASVAQYRSPRRPTVERTQRFHVTFSST